MRRFRRRFQRVRWRLGNHASILSSHRRRRFSKNARRPRLTCSERLCSAIHNEKASAVGVRSAVSLARCLFLSLTFRQGACAAPGRRVPFGHKHTQIARRSSAFCRFGKTKGLEPEPQQLIPPPRRETAGWWRKTGGDRQHGEGERGGEVSAQTF